ncbi:GIN domain-containing protein [Caulobacter sp.]|uniref:GIN domain-containing protein n=1 Tax=Caulobacter sp. TaxID=78 RepID=UPI003BB18EB0
MIRNLTIVAVASFVLALGCFAGAFALGGRDIVKNGWSFPADWNIEVDDDNDHIRIGPGSNRVDYGETTTRNVAWSGSDALQVDVPAEVIFTQAAPGAGASIQVTGPKALVDRVIVENGRIALRDDGFLHVSRNSDELSIEIVAPSVRSFTLNGSGDLYLKNYDQPDLMLEINGSGSVDAQGKARKVELLVSGSGEADLRGLDTGDARIALSGSGEAHVAPHGATEVDVAGSGDVYLTNKPSVLSSNVAGSGEVHQDW